MSRHRPQVLLLHADPAATDSVRSTGRVLVQRKCPFLVGAFTHNEAAGRYADRVMHMQDGELLESPEKARQKVMP